MIRKRYEWKIRGGAITLGERTLVMGILNVTPDSFSDGGVYADPERALEYALELQGQGADIIDVGAESTRPGSERVSEHDEIERLAPVLKKLKGRIEIPVSVDTYKPAVAEMAIRHGASIINDVSGLTWEPDLAKVVRDSGAGLILNHMRGTPQNWARMAPMRDVMGEIASELEASIHRARLAGVDLAQIVVDPGIGFGKRKEQNAEILARLGELNRLALPILVGPSRKSFLAQKTPEALEFATAAAVTASVLNGASLVRVHNVAAMMPVVATVDAVIEGIPEPRQEEPARQRTGKRVDLDLRPERAQAGPPRPAIKKPAPPPPPPPKEADPPSKPAEPPRREFPPRYSDQKRPFRPALKRTGPGGGKPTSSRPPRDDRPRDDRPRDDRPRDDRPVRGGPRSGPGGGGGRRDDRPPRGGGSGPRGGSSGPRGGSSGPRRGPSTPRRRP